VQSITAEQSAAHQLSFNNLKTTRNYLDLQQQKERAKILGIHGVVVI